MESKMAERERERGRGGRQGGPPAGAAAGQSGGSASGQVQSVSDHGATLHQHASCCPLPLMAAPEWWAGGEGRQRGGWRQRQAGDGWREERERERNGREEKRKSGDTCAQVKLCRTAKRKISVLHPAAAARPPCLGVSQGKERGMPRKIG